MRGPRFLVIPAALGWLCGPWGHSQEVRKGDAPPIFTPPPELFVEDWTLLTKDAVLPAHPNRKFKDRSIPSATVEVIGQRMDVKQEQIRSFQVWIAPQLARAFDLGWSSSCTSQMLNELMGMEAKNLRPPTTPSVWYNCIRPTEATAFNVNAGSGVTVQVQTRHP